MSIILFAVIAILAIFSIITNNALLYALVIILIFAMVMVVRSNLFVHLLIIATPFTYIATILLFNISAFDQEQFKLIAMIKIASFLIVPVLFYGYLSSKKFTLSPFDLLTATYLLSIVFYLPLGSATLSEKGTELQPLFFFIMFIYLGRFVYYRNIKISTYEKIFIHLSVVVVGIGVVMYFFSDYLSSMGLSPKGYSIISVGLTEQQFIGEFNAATYSFLFYATYGIVMRFFSIFYSAIGTAYFLSYALLAAFLNKKYLISLIILLAILFTLTTGSWLLIFLTILLTTSLMTNNMMLRNIIFFVIFVSGAYIVVKYQNIILASIQAGFLYSNVISYDLEIQSLAAHLQSVFGFLFYLREAPLGNGIGFRTGESFFVDVFGQTGVVGSTIFLLIFYRIFASLKKKYQVTKDKKIVLAVLFLIMNLIGSLFSRENYTFIVSYFSWIYIGLIYEMSRKNVVRNALKTPLQNEPIIYSDNLKIL